MSADVGGRRPEVRDDGVRTTREGMKRARRR
jgi:hypothetical protein